MRPSKGRCFLAGPEGRGIHGEIPMTRAVQAPKSDPATIAALALDGVEAGAAEVLADDTSIHIRAALSGGLTDLYPALAELYSSREPVATLAG
ncbi:hypothetical protein [Parafrankia soli]|nr:hypothetical protein [Parafrankia soli]